MDGIRSVAPTFGIPSTRLVSSYSFTPFPAGPTSSSRAMHALTPQLLCAGSRLPRGPFPAGSLALSRPAPSAAGPASHRGWCPVRRMHGPVLAAPCLDRKPHGAWTLSLPAFFSRTELSAGHTGGSIEVLCLTRPVRGGNRFSSLVWQRRGEPATLVRSCPNSSFWMERP